MINAIKVAADFLERLPKDTLSPETTDGLRRIRPSRTSCSAGVERTSVKLLVRDFVTAALKDKEALVERLARETVAAHGRALASTVKVEEQYRNMKEVLDQHPTVVEHAREAIRRAGLDPRDAADPRRHRRLAALLHGSADAEHLRRRAQLPLAAGVGVRSGHGEGGRGDRQPVPRLGRVGLSRNAAGSSPVDPAN